MGKAISKETVIIVTQNQYCEGRLQKGEFYSIRWKHSKNNNLLLSYFSTG